MRIVAIMAGGMDGPAESGRIGEVVAERGEPCTGSIAARVMCCRWILTRLMA